MSANSSIRSTTPCGLVTYGARLLVYLGLRPLWANSTSCPEAGILPRASIYTSAVKAAALVRFRMAIPLYRLSRARATPTLVLMSRDGCRPFAVPRFYDTGNQIGDREPQISGPADGVLSSPEVFHSMADCVLPWIRLGIQVVVHVEHGKIDITDLLKCFLGHIGIQHDFGTGKDHGIR